MYHGTERKRGLRILENNCMEISRGAQHWLGDGSYFYRDKQYAFRWIYRMYISRYKEQKFDCDDLIEKYMVIEAELNIKNERLFSFFNPDHKLLFDTAVEACKEKISDLEIVDGAVINFMFNIMGYKEKFDAVEALFLHHDKKILDSNVESRLYYLPEVQICVKNIGVIEKYRETDVTQDMKHYLDFSANYTAFSSGVITKKPRKYKDNVIKYKK